MNSDILDNPAEFFHPPLMSVVSRDSISDVESIGEETKRILYDAEEYQEGNVDDEGEVQVSLRSK